MYVCLCVSLYKSRKPRNNVMRKHVILFVQLIKINNTLNIMLSTI